MEKYSFFDDVENDRLYDAADFALYFSKFFTNGIFNNSLKVKADSGMNIIIETGDANINGYRYTNTEDLLKQISLADGNQSRIDNVVLRLDLPNRQISIEIIKGNYSDSPTPPLLVRSSTIYDLRLAMISVPEGITEITDQLITDCRFNSSDCGNVTQAVLELDTTELFQQYQNAFNIWFGNLQTQLDENEAANLTNQISSLKNIVAYRGTCTNEELQQPIAISNDVLKDDLGNILNPLIPRYERILEQNTVNGITYIKYNDGKLIQYGTHTYSVSTDAAYFNIGYRSAEYLFGGETYPVPFVKLDSLQITDNCTNSNSFVTSVRRNNDKLNKLPKITYVSAGRETTPLTIECSFIAIGTWK